jgi:hypothetical protein
MRRLKVDLDDLETAFSDNSGELEWFLNLATGQVILVTEDTRRIYREQFEMLGGEDDPDDAEFLAALEASNLRDDDKEELKQLRSLDSDDFIRLERPYNSSRQDYGDMEEFIATVGDARVRERLADAIDGRGAFSRFRNVLGRYPEEERRWYAFSQARRHQRIIDWMRDEEQIEIIVD